MVPMRPSWTSLTLSHSCKCELEARPSSLRAESLPLGPASFQSLVYGAGDAPHDPVQYLMGVGLEKNSPGSCSGSSPSETRGFASSYI